MRKNQRAKEKYRRAPARGLGHPKGPWFRHLGGRGGKHTGFASGLLIAESFVVTKVFLYTPPSRFQIWGGAGAWRGLVTSGVRQHCPAVGCGLRPWRGRLAALPQ